MKGETMSATARTANELLPVPEALPFAFHDSIDPSFRERVELFLDDIRRLGYDELELAPPICRMLWQRGVPLPPPVFLSFFHQLFLGAVCTGFLFGAGMTLFLGVAALAVGGFSGLMLLPLLFAFSAVSFGTLFGLFYILRTRYLAWRLRLPEWRDYAALTLPHIASPLRPVLSSTGPSCPRCGNDPLACHTHRHVWCEKCVHDIRSMGEERWRLLAHDRDPSCTIALADADDSGDYTHVLPPPDPA
jgi:hypothetical protein